MQAVSSRSETGGSIVSCIQIGKLACDPFWNGIDAPHLAIKANIVVGFKCSPTLMSRCDAFGWTVYLTCYLFTESIRKLLRWSSSSSAHICGMREGGRDKERDCMQLQPLSLAAWLVAIATWLCIPFHLPFLINSHSCLCLGNLPLSWNASLVQTTSPQLLSEDCCYICSANTIILIAFTNGNYYRCHHCALLPSYTWVTTAQ